MLNRNIKGMWHDAVEFCRNVDAALVHPHAMPATRRRLDEGKIFAGAALGVVSLESPLTLTGAFLTLAEGFEDLSEAGQKWRRTHRSVATHPFFH